MAKSKKRKRLPANPNVNQNAAKHVSDGINRRVKSAQDSGTGRTDPRARQEAAKRLSSVLGAMLKPPETVREHLNRIGVPFLEKDGMLGVPIDKLAEAEKEQKPIADLVYPKDGDPLKYEYKGYDEAAND